MAQIVIEFSSDHAAVVDIVLAHCEEMGYELGIVIDPEIT